MNEDIVLRQAFKAHYDQYREHDGKKFDVLQVIDEPDDTHDKEVLPMYLIRLETGEEIEAWPEEIIRNSVVDTINWWPDYEDHDDIDFDFEED